MSFVDWQKDWTIRPLKTGTSLHEGDVVTFEGDPHTSGSKRIIIQGRPLPWAEGCVYDSAKEELSGSFLGKEFTITRSSSGLTCRIMDDSAVPDPWGGGTTVSWTAEEGSSGTRPIRGDRPLSLESDDAQQS